MTDEPINLADCLRLMAITDGRDRDLASLVRRAAAAVRGGATAVQLRAKGVGARAMVSMARALVAALPVPVIVNDRLDVALAAGASGAHLGADDLPVARARSVVPAGFLLGTSVGSLQESSGGVDADYWGIGPWRITGSKPDAGPPIDRELFANLVRLAGPRPVVAIGGVRPDDLPSIRAAGAGGVAVVAGIFGAADCEQAARSYRAAWDAAGES